MYFVAVQTTRWTAGQPAPMPKIVTPGMTLDAAKAEAAKRNEAEGRGTDGSVPKHYFVIEAMEASA